MEENLEKEENEDEWRMVQRHEGVKELGENEKRKWL